jgi:hypothetical protein
MTAKYLMSYKKCSIDFSPESAPGMEFPGYHPPSPQPHREPGPSFPPHIPDRTIPPTPLLYHHPIKYKYVH